MIDVLEDCIYIDHSTAKLGKRDFVFKFEDRIEDSTLWYYLYGRWNTSDSWPKQILQFQVC